MKLQQKPQPVDAHTAAFLRGAAAGIGGQVALLLSMLLATVLVARSAEVAEVGQYAIAAAIGGFISLLTGLHLKNQVSRAYTDAEASGLLPWALAAGAFGAFAAAVVALISHFTAGLTVGPLVWLIPAIAVQPSTDALTGLLARTGQAGWLIVQQLVRATTRPPVVLTIIVGTASMQAHWIAMVDSIVAVGSLIAIVGCHGIRNLRRRIAHRERLRLSNLLPGLGALLIVAANWQIIQRTDLLFVGYVIGPTYAGRYEITLRLMEVIVSLYGALMVFFLPMMTRALQEGWARIAYIRATVLGAQLLFPFLALMAAWGDIVAAKLFGATFSLSPEVFAVLAIGMFAQVAAGPNGLLLMAARRHRQIAVIGCSIALLNIALNLVLVPTLGVLGAALASSAAFVALNLSYGFAIQVDVGRIRPLNSTVRWQLSYLAVLSASVTVPRLLLGTTAPAAACACGGILLIFLLSARTAHVRPIIAALVASITSVSKPAAVRHYAGRSSATD